MMKQMGVEMNHAPEMTHAIELTIINKKIKKIVDEAKVKISVINPEGEKQTKKAVPISGAGMHHYVIDFVGKETGIYKVKASAALKKKKIIVDTIFYLNE